MAIMNFNYDQAMRQANQIEEIARDMESLANQRIRGAMDHIGAIWKGEAASRYLSHCDQTRNDIQAKASGLKETATRIRNTAKILKEAEDRAREEQRRRDKK
jgi:uncharacterized protein YukE